MNEEYAIGIDIGGTKIAAGLVNARGELAEEARVLTEAAQGRDHVLGQVRQAITELQNRLAARHQGGKVIGLGVGTAGQVDFRLGKVVSATGNLPGWYGTPVKDILEREYGVPVRVDNDVNAVAWGEKWLGAGRGVDHFLCVALGTGVGGAIVDDGRMVRGAQGGAAEFGHLILFPEGLPCTCGRRGCLEAYVSGTGIARRYQLAGGTGGLRSEEVFALAHQGDHLAAQVVEETYRFLGYGVASLVNLFNPRRVIVGGGLSQVGEELLAALRQAVRDYALEGIAQDVEIVLAELGGKAGLYGAAYLIWQERGI